MKRILSALVFALSCAILPTLKAQTYGELLTSNIVISNGTATAGLNLYIGNTAASIKGLTIMPTFSAENAGTSNNVFAFQLSNDPGSSPSFTTTTPVSYTVAANGTNTVRGWYWIAPTNFANAHWIRFATLATTQTNNVTLTSLKYSIGP